MKKRSCTSRKEVEHYINLIGNLHDFKSIKRIIEHAPDSVIKSICDIALNAQHGRGFSFGPGKKRKFSEQRRVFNTLINRSIPISRKRKTLRGKGFLAILPALIGTVLGALGPAIFKKK